MQSMSSCIESKASPLLSLEGVGLRAVKTDESWILKGAQNDLKFVTSEEISLMEELANIANMDMTAKNQQNFYIATLSGAVSEDKSSDFGALADHILSKVRSPSPPLNTFPMFSYIPFFSCSFLN